jgi:hypothetical protein
MFFVLTHPVSVPVALRNGRVFLYGVAEDFEFCRFVNLTQDAIDPFHNLVLNQVFAAIPALQNRQPLNNNNGVVANLERQICNEFL